MKNLHLFLKFSIKNVVAFLILFFDFIAFSPAQTPQYYNYNNGTSYNSFPLNVAAGKMVQTLVAPGEFNQPVPAVAGNINKYYLRISTGYPLGPATYTSFKILFSQTALTVLPTGSFYPGPWDTVYQRASVNLTAAADTWLEFTLDHVFAFNPAQSLVIQIEQCGATGTLTGYSIQQTSTPGIGRRSYSSGTCPYAYGGLTTSVVNCGISISTIPTPCSNFSSSWTTGLAVIPDGATNCSRVIPSGIIINDTGYLYVMGGGTPVNINRCYNTVTNTWSTKTALPIALATTNGTTIKDSIYIIGGYIGTGTSGAVYKYDPRTDSWATKAPMPLATNTADMCIVPWRDSLIICAGGGPGLFSSSAATTAVRYYNVYTNSWVDLSGSSLLPVSQAMMASTIVGDTIYIFGGYTSANVTVGTAYRGVITTGSPISITWTAIASLPGTFNNTGKTYRSSAATIKSVNGGVLIVGGADDVGNYNGTAYLYNPCGNTYTTLTSTAGSAKSNMGARLYAFKDSIIYLAAGYNAAGQTSVLKFSAMCYNCIVSGIGNNTGNIPEKYSLSQNYPNPFNPSTKISYSLPKEGFVSLKIYDISGREIMTLVNNIRQAGTYAVDLDATSLSSGVYFYTMKVGDFSNTKRMVLIK